MSAETRKGKKKNKIEPQEQRKLCTARIPVNLQPEKKQETSKEVSTVINEELGPNFYKNLKRETDEIIKITEESNAKYSKKVIQSTWQKYEAPIESYEERDEVENMGADFEKLMNTPISCGGHFQFKHEKSWNTAITSTEYDKYFDIDMSTLATNMLTIPFNERNDLDVDLFSESDRISMAHRANKYKKLCQYDDETEKESSTDPTENVLMKLKDTLVMKKMDNEDDYRPESKRNTYENINLVEIETKSQTKSRKTEMYPKPNIDIHESTESSAQKRIVDNKEHTTTENIANQIKKLASGDNTYDDEEDLEEWLDDFLSSPDCVKH